MKDEYTTTELYDYVSRCESIDEFQQILSNLRSQRKEWMDKISEIIQDNHFSESSMAQLCGVSRQSVHKWVNGAIPKSRDTFIRIGFAANYDLDTMNHFLQRYGGWDKLYARNLEDSVRIFLLNNNKIENTYSNYEKILGLIKEELNKSDIGCEEETYETTMISLDLMRLKSIPELMDFVHSKCYAFKKQFYKLYDYIEEYINKNLLPDDEDNISLLAKSQQWSSSLRQCVSEVSQKKWYPQRNKLISLGIHLNMNISQINEMLELAQMEKLCAKVPFDSLIIYSLENAELEDLIHCDGTDELCMYVKNILSSLDFEEGEFFLEELPKCVTNDEI